MCPEGTSTLISSCQLTAALRAVDPARNTCTSTSDFIQVYHPLDVSARDPQIPGQPTTFGIGLQSTDAAIALGHRLRIDSYLSVRAVPGPLGSLLAILDYAHGRASSTRPSPASPRFRFGVSRISDPPGCVPRQQLLL
ncbi:CocE/NonD family hydrolase C-terminal non-catalytic domain-containing protein [Nocardia crassostreae]|uniref:CocE/NonD family hydrolase C-terminal non-catalytic domain-containing protein n=1 Tax=Nocardia crassostreae TaxID=53428 RepID=UPI00147182B8